MWHIPLFSLTRPLIIAADYIIIQTKPKVNTESIKTLSVYYFERTIITMKKVIGIFAAAIMMLTFTACGQTDNSSQISQNHQSSTSTVTNSTTGNSTDGTSDSSKENNDSEPVINSTDSLPEQQEPDAEGKTLIVYFSWSSSGNTEKMANYIKEQTGGDLIELEPVNAYPADYQECTKVALEERDNNVRPDIANLPGTIEEYDSIFVGYPIWWHTAPMIIGTFLESYDLTGIDVYPFTQSTSMDTEQFAQSMEFVRECASGANVHDGLFVRASDTDGIREYLTVNGFKE